MTTIEPGWYRDPADETVQRYWDGEGWLGEPIPADATPPEQPPVAAPPVQAQPVPGAQVPAQPPAQGQLAQTQQPYQQPPGYPPQQGYQGYPPQQGQPSPQYQNLAQYQAEAARRRAMARNLRPHGYPLAGVWARFWARVIDILVGLCLNTVVNGWFVWQYWRELRPALDAYQSGDHNALMHESSRSGWLAIAIVLIATALWFAYEVPSVADTGQTLGKRAMQIRVVGVESAEPLGLRRAWMRWRLMGLPTLLWQFFFVGFLLQALDVLRGVIDQPLHQTAHDRSAATIVVTVGPRNGRPKTNPTDETGKQP